MNPLVIIVPVILILLALLSGSGSNNGNGDAPLPNPGPGPIPPAPQPVPPGPGPIPFDDSAWFGPNNPQWRCNLTGETVPTVRPGHVTVALGALGWSAANLVPTDDVSARSWLLSPTGVSSVRDFQAVARSLNLGSMAGAPASYVDGKVGACTLSALRAAMMLRRAGQWSGKVAPASLSLPAPMELYRP